MKHPRPYAPFGAGFLAGLVIAGGRLWILLLLAFLAGLLAALAAGQVRRVVRWLELRLAGSRAPAGPSSSRDDEEYCECGAHVRSEPCYFPRELELVRRPAGDTLRPARRPW